MESSFSESRSERSRKAFLRVLPPRRHILAIVTGGLKRLYSRIRENKEISHNEGGKFTDKLGRFQPPEGLLLASRYHVLSILPSWGQSAMLVRAQDVVRDNMMVMIKALHSSQLYFEIGFQEAHMLRRLACADPHGFSHTVRLLNTFLHDHHFCLVFELLDPRPITHVLASLNLSHKKKLKVLRKVTLQLLQVIGFLQQNNTIHADLKPENILLNDVHDASSLRVIDFGNAINHVHREMSLYYRDFQVQTLLYRAPEVVFGMPFGAEIDMWSVGCILAEIYLGKPLISGTDRITLVQSMVDVLGPLPHRLFQRGKYFEQLESFATKDSGQSNVTLRLMARFQQRTQPDFNFANLLSGLLCYDPDKRLTPAQAAQHPFLAPEVCLSYLRSDAGSQHEMISTVFLSHEDYKNRPQIAVEVCRQGPSSTDLLRMGTSKHCKDSPKHVASLMSLSESHGCAVSHLHDTLCKLQSKGQHTSGEDEDLSLNSASVSVCAHMSSLSDGECQTCQATAQDLLESQTTCTHPQGRKSQGQTTCSHPQSRGCQAQVSNSQARESAVVLCQSPDTTCVMEISHVVTHNDDQQHSKYCELYNKSEIDVKRFQHSVQQHSQNNICRTLAPQVSNSSKKVYGKLQEMHITSQNKSLAVGRHEATQACALAADSSAKGLLLHKPAPSSRCSTEREWKECGSSNRIAENSPCPQDLCYKEGLVMSQEHRDHSCKSTCACEDAGSLVQSPSLNETFTIKDTSLDEDDVLGVDMNVPEISASLMQVGSPNKSIPSKTEACQSEVTEDCPGPRNTCILGFSKTSSVELLSGTESRCCKSEFPSAASYNIHDMSLIQSDSVGHCRAALTLDGGVGLKCGKKTARKNDDAQVKDIQLHSLSSSTVDSFNSKNSGISCANVTFDSDCSNDSSHEKFRNFINAVSQDTPLALPYPAWNQSTRQHRMQADCVSHTQADSVSHTQADSVSHTQVNIIPHSSKESTAGCIALFPDGRPHCLWRKSNSSKKVRSETSKCTWKDNKNAQNVLGGVGQRACSISSSLAGDVGHDQEAKEFGHHRTAVVAYDKMIPSDSLSKLKPPRLRNLFGVHKKTTGSKRIQVDAFAEEKDTTTCGMTPAHQDSMTSDGTLLLPQDPYLQRAKSRGCPEKNEKRYSARYKSKELSNPLHTKAGRQFLPKIRSPQRVLEKRKGQLAPTFDQELLSPAQFTEREFLPRSSKVTKYTQPQDKVTSFDNIQISCMLPCNGKQVFLSEQNRKKKCKHDVGMLGDLPWGITGPIFSEGETERGISRCNFSVGKTDITGPIFSEGKTERHISGCNFSVGKAETDSSQSASPSQVNPDLGFSNNSNFGKDRIEKVVANDSLSGLKLGASHLKSSLEGRKSDMGRISLAIAAIHTVPKETTAALHSVPRDRQVQRAKEEANQHLRFPDESVDEMHDVRQRHKDKPRRTLEMPDDGDDDVIMLIQ